jgi:hypothetical protein
MKCLSKLFSRRNIQVTVADEHIVDELMGQIDESMKKIFDSLAVEILSEPFVNVVAAIWGTADSESRLTPTQRQIDCVIRPMIRQIRDALETDELTGAKNYVIDCLIKKLVISQLLLAAQQYEFSLLALARSKATDADRLAGVEVAGHA